MTPNVPVTKGVTQPTFMIQCAYGVTPFVTGTFGVIWCHELLTLVFLRLAHNRVMGPFASFPSVTLEGYVSSALIGASCG